MNKLLKHIKNKIEFIIAEISDMYEHVKLQIKYE